MAKYNVYIDYPQEIMEIEAGSKEEAEEIALKKIGTVTFNAEKEATAEAELL